LALVPILAAGLTACASLTDGASPGPAGEPDRLSERLADLVERLRPALVQIGAGPGSERGARPGAAGFIVDPGGIVLTVAHVVPGGERVEVELSDGRRFPGRVLGRDTRTDLAAVRIEGPAGLPALPLGDSDRVRAGQLVLALGHPFGLRQAASFGIVSWQGAPPGGGPPDFDFIHTDASASPGNSGGPLVNLDGEAIGVNSWAARDSSMGIAVPSALVRLVLPRLVADGRVEWGWIGTSLERPRPEELRRLGLREAGGLSIREVVPGGPADQAGLRPGDVIVAVEGEPVGRPRDLHRLILAAPAGRTLGFALLRDGQRTEAEVTPTAYREVAGGPDQGTGAAPF
jgi:S1-C subfamily serine protease